MPTIRKPGAGQLLRFQAGHLIEEVIRPHVAEQFSDIKSNLRLASDTLDMTGEMDNYDEDSGTIVEIKSVHVWAIRNKRVNEDRFHLKDDRQYYHHEIQQHAYVALLQERGLPVNQIIYLYIALDGRIAPYVTPVKQEILDEVHARLAVLNRYWAQQELPPCTCYESDPYWKAVNQFCDYQDGVGCCSQELNNPKEG